MDDLLGTFIFLPYCNWKLLRNIFKCVLDRTIIMSGIEQYIIYIFIPSLNL
jgi:hypothetical protein